MSSIHSPGYAALLQTLKHKIRLWLLREAVAFSVEPKKDKVPRKVIYRLFASLQDNRGDFHRVRLVLYPTDDGLYLYDLTIRKKLEGSASGLQSATGAARWTVTKPSMTNITDLLDGVKPGPVISYQIK